MSKCDLCGGDTRASEMTELLKYYRIPGVTDICPACEKWANKTLNSIRDGITPAMRKAIAEKAGKPPFRWWHIFAPAVSPESNTGKESADEKGDSHEAN